MALRNGKIPAIHLPSTRVVTWRLQNRRATGAKEGPALIIRTLSLASLLLLGLPAAAAQAGQAAEPAPEAGTEAEPSRVINLIVYGEDACPEAENPDEIVVCGRRPESDRYRIPKDLRSKPEESSAAAWTTQMEALDADARPSRPGSCSAVGSYGQSGCFQQRLEQWQAERRDR